MKRIVIKVGSNVLTTASGKLDITRMSALVDQMAELRKNACEVILVTSGAVAAGRRELPVMDALDSVEQRQLFSAIGQVKLVNLYYDLFREYGVHIGQVLAMKENFEVGDQYNNMNTCMQVMLKEGVIPVVNENDTVAITELMFTDNDELSGLIARMLDADALVILSNVDGLYDGHPSNPETKVIAEVSPERDIESYIQTEKSGAGRGGMQSKCATARAVQQAGIDVYIANGKTRNILVDLLLGKGATCTHFVAKR